MISLQIHSPSAGAVIFYYIPLSIRSACRRVIRFLHWWQDKVNWIYPGADNTVSRRRSHILLTPSWTIAEDLWAAGNVEQGSGRISSRQAGEMVGGRQTGRAKEQLSMETNFLDRSYMKWESLPGWREVGVAAGQTVLTATSLFKKEIGFGMPSAIVAIWISNIRRREHPRWWVICSMKAIKHLQSIQGGFFFPLTLLTPIFRKKKKAKASLLSPLLPMLGVTLLLLLCEGWWHWNQKRSQAETSVN